MEIVIKIPKEIYTGEQTAGILPIVVDAIGKGIPLPEDRGRLIDYGSVVDAIDDWINAGEYSYTNATDYLRKRIIDVPPIIEANKGVLEKINEKQNSLRATCKAWEEAISRDGYVN